MADGLRRACLWSMPRSVSTAMVKCLSYVDGIQVVNQLYAVGHYMGVTGELPEPDPNNSTVCQILDTIRRFDVEKDKASGIDYTMLSYQWIRDEVLEASYPDKKLLLCRDQAQYLNGRYDMLPRGFKHSFLIRHPIRVFRSYKTFLANMWGCEIPDMRALPPIAFPSGCGFKELYDLAEYVRENIDPSPVILDADDLLQDPAGILSTYCSRMGIPYSDNLLSWQADGDDITKTWIMGNIVQASNRRNGFYKRAFESVGFEEPSLLPDLASLPDDVQACVEYSMDYYERLHRERIKPQNN
ncbi:branched-chain-amino-acid aminotransferase-like protein 2 [Patiria miniata]|uniref:Sulfotransferase family protein n=1 Tax=Patiria miniata TaxID=46514 RepID=A0A914B5Q7_PATMI|nr:branched-chain-amino-acid aminotransferase-like protein 2 [Patiria miniata]